MLTSLLAGDAYVAISNVYEENDKKQDHIRKMLKLACSILEVMPEISKETGIPLDVRIGIHRGPMVSSESLIPVNYSLYCTDRWSYSFKGAYI